MIAWVGTPPRTHDDGGELPCPYCGHKLRDLFEVKRGPHICDGEGCGRSFLVEVETVTTYTATPIEDVPC